MLLNTAGEYLDYMENPLRIARQATIPMLDAESYQRDWFITALLLAPLAALLYLHQFSIFTLLGGLALGAVLSLSAAWATKGADKDTPPLWDLGTGFPLGAAIVACASLTLAAMWVDVIASELVRLRYKLCRLHVLVTIPLGNQHVQSPACATGQITPVLHVMQHGWTMGIKSGMMRLCSSCCYPYIEMHACAAGRLNRIPRYTCQN